MTSTNRRQFLKLAATSVGTAAASVMFPDVIQRALVTPADTRTGTLMDVEHVVILMQENRSFDHYFGCLRGVRGFGDPRPFVGQGERSVFHQPRAEETADYVLPFHTDTATTNAACLSDLDHSWKGSHDLWKNHDAWVRTKTAMSMAHFTRDDIPFYYALADAFTICDAYHSSIHGPTNPNRLYLFSGTSGQTVANEDDHNDTGDMARDDPAYAGYTWTTTAERLQEKGVTWRVYQEYDNFGDNALAFFKAFRNLDVTSEAYRRARAIVPGSNQANAASSRGEWLLQAFASDVEQGRLPQVSWIVAPSACCEHPKASPASGERFVSRLLDALVTHPDVWSRTVFLLNYDENDGFFDHVPPAVPSLDEYMGQSTTSVEGEDHQGTPIGLGFRVPMLVVSPWSTGGWVCSEQFDHTSVIRFLERRFGIQETNITPWRRAVTGDLISAFDFAHPDHRTPNPLPRPIDDATRTPAACTLPAAQVPAMQTLPRQEVGQRYARPLPYDVHVHGSVSVATGELLVQFVNQGRVGATFIASSSLNGLGPWHYTVTPGCVLAARWPARESIGSGYDITVHGPNGFMRSFRGDVPPPDGPAWAAPEVHVRHDKHADALILALSNAGITPCMLTVTPNRYLRQPPRQYVVQPGRVVEDAWPLHDSAHWYDFDIRSDADKKWLRRVAGHIETGRPSLSDPAFGEERV